jgi:3-isopropylmalate/(R)-2-methylmalate dehydratase large subunit
MVMLPCDERKNQKDATFTEKAAVAGTALQAGQIGGYTGGTIEDLRIAASLLEGKKLALGFRLSICPATSADYIQACEEGLITQFIDYGAQINAAGDHSEIIQGAGAMGTNEALITTGLYTYTGAMGVPSSRVYSASVQSVAMASVSKEI